VSTNFSDKCLNFHTMYTQINSYLTFLLNIQRTPYRDALRITAAHFRTHPHVVERIFYRGK
jgi:hypothetical protein